MLAAVSGWRWAGEALPRPHRERILGAAASLAGLEVNWERPELSVEIARPGFRIQGSVPPLSPGPEIIFRRPPPHTFTLDDFGGDFDPETLHTAILHRCNILVSGSTGTGKTCLQEALCNTLHQVDPHLHLYVIEDAAELRSPFALTSWRRVGRGPGQTARAALAAAMRSNPDRVILSEARGAEALDLLKVWGTGHPGGFATVHANSARGALTRIDQLAQEAGVPPQPALVGEVVDVVIHLSRAAKRPEVAEILYVHHWGAASGEYVVETLEPGTRIGPNGPEV